MPTDMGEMSLYTQVCRCLTECCCGCRYGVGAPWRPVKLLKPGLVWSSSAGVVLDGLCEKWWSRWTWRLVRNCRCCPSCRVVILCRHGKRCSKSPSSLSTRCCSCSTIQRSVVQRQLGRSLSTRSNTPRQQREGPTAIFWNFFCLWGWVPILVGAPPNFEWHPNMPFWTL